MRNTFPYEDGKRSTVRACGNDECAGTSKWRSPVSTSPKPAPLRRWHDRPQRILTLGERSKPNGRDRRSVARGAAQERGSVRRAPHFRFLVVYDSRREARADVYEYAKENKMWPPKKRAVAFLDVMGFKKLIEKAEQDESTYEKFSSLKDVIETHVQRDNNRLAPTVPPQVKPSYLFISDSIVISVPLEFDGYDGLVIVAIKSIELAHKLLEIGFLLRGGISIGNVWHEPRNVFGTGYIEAYNLEESVKPPRIVLSNEASMHLHTAKHSNVPLKELQLWLSTKHYTYLDALHPWYLRSTDADENFTYESAFNKYRDHISSSLDNPMLSAKIHKKWDAMRIQFNRAIKQHQINIHPL